MNCIVENNKTSGAENIMTSLVERLHRSDRNMFLYMQVVWYNNCTQP